MLKGQESVVKKVCFIEPECKFAGLQWKWIQFGQMELGLENYAHLQVDSITLTVSRRFRIKVIIAETTKDNTNETVNNNNLLYPLCP